MKLSDAVSLERQGLSEILKEWKPTPANYLAAARAIEERKISGLKPLRVAFVSTFTVDFLKPYVAVECARRGMKAELYFAPFNQLEQQLLASDSLLYQWNPGIVVIAARIEDLMSELTHQFLKMSTQEIDREKNFVVQRIMRLATNARRHTTGTIFVFNFSVPPITAAGIADAWLPKSQSSTISSMNHELIEKCRTLTDVYLFDYAQAVLEIGTVKSHDPKLWYMAKSPWGFEGQLQIGKILARYFRAACFSRTKCLVLDLDNTLWGGIIGEEGIEGIRLGENYPGNVFKDFQRYLLLLRDRGILLAIASKNNEADIREVFEKHPDMILKWDDFSVRQIHWNDKVISLQAIAHELSIGTDALAFFDDNPAEREWIRTQMPEVTVIDASANPMEYIRTLEDSGAFDQLVLSDEDRRRADSSKHGKKRQAFKSAAGSLRNFLKELGVVVTPERITKENLPRVAQLIAKTNQFNLTNRRYTAAELLPFVGHDHIAIAVRVKDRFEDFGLVGAALLKEVDSYRWEIDTLLLSCRALGKQVENAFLHILFRKVKERDGKMLIGKYEETPKNTPAKDFFKNQGFVPENQDFSRCWKDISSSEIDCPEFIKIEWEKYDASN